MKTFGFVLGLSLALSSYATPQSPTATSSGGPIPAKVNTIEIDVAGADGSGTARVFVPVSDSPLPVIVFSHSTIAFADQTVSLMPMAEALAREGNAVLVLERAMTWPPKSDRSNRDGGQLLENSEKWLLGHVRVDPERFAYVGPNYDTAEEPYSLQALPRDGKRITRAFRVNIGEPGDPQITEKLRTSVGQRETVQWLERALQSTTPTPGAKR